MLTAAASQCDRAFLTGQAAKAGGAQITGTPAFATLPAGKQGLMAALGAAPAVVTLAVDASFQHYHAGLWSPAAACSTTGEPAVGCGRAGRVGGRALALAPAAPAERALAPAAPALASYPLCA